MLKKHRQLKLHICYVCELLNHALQVDHEQRYELLTIKTKFEMLVEMMEIHLSKGKTILFGGLINLWYKFILQNDYPTNCCQRFLFVRLVARQSDITNTMLSELNQLCRFYRLSQPISPEYQAVCQSLDLLEEKLKAVLNPKGSGSFQETLLHEQDLLYENH